MKDIKGRGDRQVATGPRGRVLYFDIDGTLHAYDDTPKPALAGGNLQGLLVDGGFDALVCVSGWCDVYAQLGLVEAARVVAIHRLVSAIFPDRGWFTAHARVISDTDHRCRAIDLSEDWWYVDDWADKFFAEAHGALEYERWLGSRILRCDPYGDGSDIVEWLMRLPCTDRGAGQPMASQR